MVKNFDTIWNGACQRLRKTLDEDTFNRWISSIVPLRLEGGQAVLGVSDDFYGDWVREHYQDFIVEALAAETGETVAISFEAGHLPPEAGTAAAEEEVAAVVEPAAAVKESGHAPNCHSKHTFENYVVGESNQFAYHAALTVTRTPGKALNPLFIYGGTGLGKTHLLQAVTHAAISKRKVVEYLTCENFMNLYIEALQSHKIHGFRKRFRMVDFLLIDDVQFLSKTTQLQEEFFNTFNSLYNSDKQIVLASDRPPSEIGGLESRLVSRFGNGLTIDIQPPSFETRMAILKKKQEAQTVKIADQILFYIATKITSNIKILEGALTKLTTYALFFRKEIDLTTAEKLLHASISHEASKVTVEAIQKKVADYFDLRLSDLTGNKRPRNIAMPRMIAMYLSREMTDRSLPEIGESFGRNHATVIHAVNKIKEDLGCDEKIRHAVAAITRQLQTA